MIVFNFLEALFSGILTQLSDLKNNNKKNPMISDCTLSTFDFFLAFAADLVV